MNEAQDVVHDDAALLDRADDGGEVVVGDEHGGGFLRYLGAADADRDTDIGLAQRGRIVNAIAGHRDDVALALQRSDDLELVLG